MNAIFKYPGSKWSVAKWIIDFFPEHHSYLEPFAGILAVLMNKPRSQLVSGYDNELYNELLKGWYRKETTAYSQVCSKKREILWMNFRPAETKQLTLFGLED